MKETEGLSRRLGPKFGTRAGKNKLKQSYWLREFEVDGRKILS